MSSDYSLFFIFFFHILSVSVVSFPFSPSFKTCLLSCFFLTFLFFTLVQPSSAELLLCLSAAQQLVPQNKIHQLLYLCSAVSEKMRSTACVHSSRQPNKASQGYCEYNFQAESPADRKTSSINSRHTYRR